jgi:hypothetical protein
VQGGTADGERERLPRLVKMFGAILFLCAEL